MQAEGEKEFMKNMLKALSPLLLAFAGASHAAETPQLIPVWPGNAPGVEGDATNTGQDTMAPWGERIVRNVVKPTLEVYKPDAKLANGTAVIVAPGGGFRFISIDNEGTKVADALTAKGVTVFLLRYRLMPTPPTDAEFTAQLGELLGPLFGPAIYDEMKRWGAPAVADTQQAIKLVRSRAREWKIAPERIGIVGFSAGGVAALGVTLDHDAASRPAFVGLIYPGPWPLEKIPKDLPPVFIAAANDDALTKLAAVPQGEALARAGAKVETHFYEKGGHGFGMKQQGMDADGWIDAFGAWLGTQGLLKKAK
jgi:acetyl esterase/lipase